MPCHTRGANAGRPSSTRARGLMAIACALLAAGLLSTPSHAQVPQSAWDLLARLATEQDTPSTPAERASSPLPADASRVVYLVRPSDTDARIDHFLKDHYVMYDRAVPQNGKLFVFLPGTWGWPAAYQFVVAEAARAGYKAIGLEYPDDAADRKASAVEQICAGNTDLDCAAQVRSIRIWGGTADGVTVSPANGLENRLARLLAYLAAAHPSEGWGTFLAAGRVQWSLVAVGGHSQGAGMAAFLAKRFAVARVALWSGPTDYMPASHGFASWLRAASATPSDRWYALVHRDEAGSRVFLAAYGALGIPGTPAVADTSVPRDTHQFMVTLPPRGGTEGPVMPAIASADHGSVATDLRTPLDALGRPVYAAVWRALIGP